MGEINIFHNGISCLIVMCLQNGMLCLFVIHIPLICLLTLGKIHLVTFNQYFPKWNILICVTIYPSILTFISFSQHGLRNLKCSEEVCLADFVLQRDTKMKYTGACSLEFQSVMQILTKCMLRWDSKTQSSKRKGILGMV
jgi:hypothetical protein